jgi:hypothetical protein
MKPIIPFLIPLLFMIGSCGADDKQDSDLSKKGAANRGIILSQNTSLRINPYIFSSKIKLLDRGDKVDVLERSAEKSWIGNTEDYWYRIRTSEDFRGWVYGRTIKILTGDDTAEVEKSINKFWAREFQQLKEDLTGKWWSINKFGDFTRHGLELYPDGTYRSYYKGGKKGAIEGKYNIDFNNNDIVFLKGATFGKTIRFVKAGTGYYLMREMENYELRMKKIQKELDEDENKQVP